MKIPRLSIHLLLFSLLAFISLPGCNGIFNGKSTEGTIEYEISYPGMSSAPMGAPDKATYKFKKLSSITEFSGMMGLVKITYMADGDKKNAQQSLCLVDKKYVSDLNHDQIDQVNAEFVKSAESVNGSKEIAGFNCKKAKITLNDGTTFDAWYTTELGTEGLNWCNPYHQLKGVMMEFEMRKYGITMKLTAKNVTKDPVSDNDWKVPGDYKKVGIKEQNKILEDLAPH
jgi:hypothetical protein